MGNARPTVTNFSVMVAVRKTKILIYVICGAIASGSAALADTTDISTSIPIEQQVQEVVSHLDGAMDTSAQASANPKAPNVRITSCKVKVEDAATLNRPQEFLYQEQALSRKLTQPYRQRFLRIAPSADKRSVESAVFKPPTPAAWTGLCGVRL